MLLCFQLLNYAIKVGIDVSLGHSLAKLDVLGMQFKGALMAHQFAVAPTEVLHRALWVKVAKYPDGSVSASQLLFNHLSKHPVDNYFRWLLKHQDRVSAYRAIETDLLWYGSGRDIAALAHSLSTASKDHRLSVLQVEELSALAALQRCPLVHYHLGSL